jgi:hypothetical protein
MRPVRRFAPVVAVLSGSPRTGIGQWKLPRPATVDRLEAEQAFPEVLPGVRRCASNPDLGNALGSEAEIVRDELAEIGIARRSRRRMARRIGMVRPARAIEHAHAELRDQGVAFPVLPVAEKRGQTGRGTRDTCRRCSFEEQAEVRHRGERRARERQLARRRGLRRQAAGRLPAADRSQACRVGNAAPRRSANWPRAAS